MGLPQMPRFICESSRQSFMLTRILVSDRSKHLLGTHAAGDQVILVRVYPSEVCVICRLYASDSRYLSGTAFGHCIRRPHLTSARAVFSHRRDAGCTVILQVCGSNDSAGDRERLEDPAPARALGRELAAASLDTDHCRTRCQLP